MDYLPQPVSPYLIYIVRMLVEFLKKMIDYHEDYIISFTKELLDEAIVQKEIKKIDTQALALLLGGIGRDFAKDSNVKKLSDTPEKSANSITEIILNGIKLEK